MDAILLIYEWFAETSSEIISFPRFLPKRKFNEFARKQSRPACICNITLMKLQAGIVSQMFQMFLRIPILFFPNVFFVLSFFASSGLKTF